jgi:hypothetical protein
MSPLLVGGLDGSVGSGSVGGLGSVGGTVYAMTCAEISNAPAHTASFLKLGIIFMLHVLFLFVDFIVFCDFVSVCFFTA